MSAVLQLELDKRWLGREQRWVAPGRVFDASRYSVDVLASTSGRFTRSSNALYAGLSTPRTSLITPDGRPISTRALSKLTSGDKGRAYAERQLLDAGAPSRRASETAREWLGRIRLTPGFTRRRHPGNLTYLFGLTLEARRELAQLHRGGRSYPKKPLRSAA